MNGPAIIYDKMMHRRDTSGYVPSTDTKKPNREGRGDTGSSADIGKIVSLMSGDGSSRLVNVTALLLIRRIL
jgi:hypothetical protein